jgi:hypothetical protein
MNNYSIEKFYISNKSISEITCGNTNSLIDTTCNTMITDINKIRNYGNPFIKKQNSLNFYNIYINSSINIPKIQQSIDKLNEIKLTLEQINKYEKIKKYIDDVIIAYNNKNTSILTDAVKTFTDAANFYSIFNKYNIPSLYKYSDLITTQTIINADYNTIIITKTTQQNDYNTIIKNNISNMVLEGIDTDFIINKMSFISNGLYDSFTWNDIITNLNYLYLLKNIYDNSAVNYKNATDNEVLFISKLIPLFVNINLSFNNYYKALIGISETIDPKLLNIQSLISYPNM